MTRAEIRKKHGVTRLETSNISNEELSKEDAEAYEKILCYMISKGKKQKG